MYNLGDVLHWKKFPLQHDGVIKDRYFIFLGKNSCYSYQVNFYTVTPTTQIQHYARYNSREDIQHITISAGKFGLPRDSIIDIDTWFTEFHDNTLLESNQNISVVGTLDPEMLVRIYHLILKSTRRVSLKVKQDIYECYMQAGIAVPKPRRKKRKKY